MRPDAPHSPTRRQSPTPLIDTPSLEDAASIWQLVATSGSLDPNSPYAYLLLCRDFADTCLVARGSGSDLAGFVAAYRPPGRPDCVFVWQIAVAPERRGTGLASRLLDALVARTGDVRFLEATATPSNHASRRLFERFAQHRRAFLQERPGFCIDHFPGGAHEEERLLRIGPLVHRRAR